MRTLFCTLLVLAALGPTACFAQETPTLSGVVTRYASPTDFDANGSHILISKNTHFQQEKVADGKTFREDYTSPSAVDFHLGSELEIKGSFGPKTSIKADTVLLKRPIVSRPVNGTALIENVTAFAPNTSSAGQLLRADGYTIRITPKTSIHYVKPLSSPSDIHSNIWITYSGTLEPDGTVLASSADFSPNVLTKAFLDLKDYWEYDPSITPIDTHQSAGSKLLRGIDPAQFPPCHDPALESRLQTVGHRLIPAWQTTLPASDPTRMNFRFYLIDRPDSRTIFPLPSGIILVPCTLVKRLPDDSQLAAILANRMAGLLEQQCQPVPLTNKQLAEQASITGAEYIPRAGTAVSAVVLTEDILVANRLHRELAQRQRVELSLLHDAGFDILEAPVAAWMLASKNPKDISKIQPPRQALDLYRLIGEQWRPVLTPPMSGSGGQQ